MKRKIKSKWLRGKGDIETFLSKLSSLFEKKEDAINRGYRRIESLIDRIKPHKAHSHMSISNWAKANSR